MKAAFPQFPIPRVVLCMDTSVHCRISTYCIPLSHPPHCSRTSPSRSGHYSERGHVLMQELVLRQRSRFQRDARSVQPLPERCPAPLSKQSNCAVGSQTCACACSLSNGFEASSSGVDVLHSNLVRPTLAPAQTQTGCGATPRWAGCSGGRIVEYRAPGKRSKCPPGTLAFAPRCEPPRARAPGAQMIWVGAGSTRRIRRVTLPPWASDSLGLSAQKRRTNVCHQKTHAYGIGQAKRASLTELGSTRGTGTSRHQVLLLHCVCCGARGVSEQHRGAPSYHRQVDDVA
eukprot:gene16666-biopygen15838